MVLSSQTPRAGMSRMYMSSRPKSGKKWGWIVLIGIALVSMYVFVWSGNDQGPASDTGSLPSTAQAGAPNPSDSGSATPAADQKRPASVKEMSLPNSNPTQPAEPVVQTIRVGETQGRTPIGTPKPAASAQPTTNTQAAPQTSRDTGSQLTRGMNLIREGRLVQGRRELSQVLTSDNSTLSALDAQTIRDTLASVNKQLVFSDQVVPGDPLAESYMVQRGDYLSVIGPRYKVPYQFIESINNTPAERLQAGKPIKLIKGPFHARISKRDFRMDLFLNDADGTPIYIRSFSVGLGKDDSTPMGSYIIAPGSKVENPSWRNPRTSEHYTSNDPKNPIGEYWMALKGTDVQTESLTGYGIHGTIEPDSIGREASMGCVRLRDKDIELVFDMLEPGQSTVHIGW